MINENNLSLLNMIKQLEATRDLSQDLFELKSLGLLKEELSGYEEFFLENYYIDPLWRIINE